MQTTEIRLWEKCELHFRPCENPAMFANDRRLICPQCGESLVRADVEVFSACPYCSFQFEPSEELEDFILEPEVDSWVRRQPGFMFQFLHPAANRD